MLNRLAHYSVRCADLEISKAFYVEALGLTVGVRPPFGFPGVWLYFADGESCSEQGCVHLIGNDAAEAVAEYLGTRAAGEDGATGAFDHVAFIGDDWPKLQGRLERQGIRYSERFVPLLGIRQVFFSDPDGLTIELNYPGSG